MTVKIKTVRKFLGQYANRTDKYYEACMEDHQIAMQVFDLEDYIREGLSLLNRLELLRGKDELHHSHVTSLEMQLAELAERFVGLVDRAKDDGYEIDGEAEFRRRYERLKSMRSAQPSRRRHIDRPTISHDKEKLLAAKLRAGIASRTAADLCLVVAFGMGLFFAAFSIASPWIGFLVGLSGCALVTSLAFASIKR